MLHARFQNRRPSGSGEEDFLKVFAVYSHGGHLGHVTLTICKKLSFPHPMDTTYKIWLWLVERLLRKLSFTFNF